MDKRRLQSGMQLIKLKQFNGSICSGPMPFFMRILPSHWAPWNNQSAKKNKTLSDTLKPLSQKLCFWIWSPVIKPSQRNNPSISNSRAFALNSHPLKTTLLCPITMSSSHLQKRPWLWDVSLCLLKNQPSGIWITMALITLVGLTLDSMVYLGKLLDWI